MELKLQKQPVAVCELLLDTVAESPIECDLLLPDYCPDIVRVLCCRVQASCSDCTARKSTLTVEGMATASLCYIGEVGGMRKTEYKIPFSKSFELSREVNHPICSVTIEPGQINYRAVSRRRLDLRGALLIRVRLYDASEQQAVTQAEGQGVQLLQREYPGARLDGQSNHRFSLAEQLSTAVGKQPAAEIVQVDCRPVVQDCRPVAGRAVLKGELLIHLLYKTDAETGALENCDYSLPFSQLIEMPGLTDETHCEAQVSCLSAECGIDEFEEGVRLEVQLSARLRCFSPVVLSGAVDSFSTLYPTENTMKNLKIPRRCETAAERATIRCEAPVPEGATSLHDCWAVPSGISVKNDGGVPTLTGQLQFTMLTAGGELGIDSATQSCDFSVAMPQSAAGCELLPDITVLSAVGTLLQGKAQLSAEILVSGLLIEFESRQLLTDLTVDDAHPRTTDRSIGLMIYYAAAGESVWEIAKRYGALPGQVMADNDLDEETLTEATPLMIPTACERGE